MPAGTLPAKIGRYEVRRIIGEGAFGRVYHAFDPELHRDVAIKVPHANALTPELRERFLREARAAATIHHPNVCPIHDVGIDGDVPYIVMHFIEGGTLDRLLKKRARPFPGPHAAAIVRKIALGIAAAHEKGVLHRDLKPANVLWDEAHREVLVTDFGLARIGGAAQISRTGDILGTPAYMSPEQARGKQDEIGPLTDVYSLGVILYRLITGKVPFDGSVMEVLARAQFDDAQPPSLVYPGLDTRLDSICLKAMARKTEERFASAKELAASLADYIRASERTQAGASATMAAEPPQDPPFEPLSLSGPTLAFVEEPAADNPPPRPVGDARPEARSDIGKSRSRVALLIAAAILVTSAIVGGIFALVSDPGAPGAGPEPLQSPLEVARAQTAKPAAPAKTAPEPKMPEPKAQPQPKTPEPKAQPQPKNPEAKQAEPKPLEPESDAASRERLPIGEVRTPDSITLTRLDNGPWWLRFDPAGEKGVTSYDQVLCLPGFKSDVHLESGVRVHLWGNIPGLLPARLLESKVRFHVPLPSRDGKGRDSDADISLLAGRIYVSTERAAGAKVRVRFGREIWDIALPDSKSEVMVEVMTAYVPGTPLDRTGGQPPRVEARAAIIRGSARLNLVKLSRTFNDIAAPAVVEWDSKTNTVVPPKPIEPGNGYYDKLPLLSSESARVVAKAMAEMARRETRRDGVKPMLLEILNGPPSRDRIAITQLAVYGYAAIISGEHAGEELNPLVEILHDEIRGYARPAAINALSTWIAQDPGNTALLEKQVAAKTNRKDEPEIIIQLLRGSVSPTQPDPAALDRLVEYLKSPSVAVRELAQWNLINFVDPAAAQTQGMLRDVAATGPEYDQFVARWKIRIEELKKQRRN